MEALEKHLKSCKFEKNYKKLKKKLKDKRIIVYGTGLLFQHIQKNYDLSELNIIGVSDIKYSLSQEGEMDLGYPIVPKSKIEEYNPEVVLLGVQEYVDLTCEFTEEIFQGSSVKVVPLVRQPLLMILKKILFED